MTEPTPGQLIAQTFNCTVWIERDGKTTRGERPAWLDWPMHTAAEIGPKWEAPKQKGRK
jgi:hypothetical protein